MFWIIKFLLLLLLSNPLIAAEEPQEELKVKPAPEFKIDIVKMLEPTIKKNYWTIQGFVAIYLVLEFYLFPYLDQLEEASRKERRKKRYEEQIEFKRQFWEERRQRESVERELDRDAEEITSLENWDYFKDDD